MREMKKKKKKDNQKGRIYAQLVKWKLHTKKVNGAILNTTAEWNGP